MLRFSLAAVLSMATRWGWFAEGRFLGKVLDEWIVDSRSSCTPGCLTCW